VLVFVQEAVSPGRWLYAGWSGRLPDPGARLAEGGTVGLGPSSAGATSPSGTGCLVSDTKLSPCFKKGTVSWCSAMNLRYELSSRTAPC